MALSGNFSDYGYAGYSNLGLYITWSASQSTSGNYSNVTVNVYLKSYNISVNAKKVTVTAFGVDGEFTSNSITDKDSTWNNQNLGSVVIKVPHNSDGTMSGTIKVNYPIAATIGSTTVDEMEATSSTITLDTIPRASSFTITGSELGSAVTVTITRASTSFTHKVEWKYGSSDYTTVSSSATTSASFTPALSYASQYPNSTSGTLTVRVTTYNGSTQIGSSVTKTLTLSIPSSVVPTMDSPTATLVDLTSGALGVYCKGYSKATIKINNASGIYGSTIAAYKITGGGYSSTSSSLTTGTLTASGTITFTCTITDSRGRSCTKQVSITVYAYKSPTLSATAKRCKIDGTLSTSGTYVLITPKFSISSVNGKNGVKSGPTATGNGNTATGSASGTSFILGSEDYPFSVSSTYVITVSITDKVSGEISTEIVIPTDIRIMNIKKNGNGVAIGGFANEDGVLKSYWDLKVDGDIYSNDTKVSVEGHTHSYLPLTGGTLTGNVTANGTLTTKNGLEISHSTPYVDFHFGNSTVDYTSRIIETASGVLSINGVNCSNGVVTGNLNGKASGNSPLGCTTTSGGATLLFDGAELTYSFDIDDTYKYFLVQCGTASSRHLVWIFIPHCPTYISTYFRGIGGYETDSTSSGGRIYFLNGSISSNNVTILSIWMRNSTSFTTTSSATQMYIRRVVGVK